MPSSGQFPTDATPPTSDQAGMSDTRQAIAEGRTTLGIELGSSRIKAVLVGPDFKPVATGSHAWENQLVNGLWTYPLEAVWSGLQDCYRTLADDVIGAYGVELRTVDALGVSGMMHGYLAFDNKGQLLVPFRTWRNTNTGAAAERLSREFEYNIPHRWSVAHLYQAILDGEDHVSQVDYLTTLAGYLHWQLTGKKVLGIGDASGMFPIDPSTGGFHTTMIAEFDRLADEAGVRLSLADLLPTVKVAGQDAGRLSDAGARLLDPGGQLESGILVCPPEGDAGTGMVATNSVAPRTGHVSAGTSIFAMVVLEHDLRRQHREIDLVTTPAGDLTAMVHCNNGASEINAWVGLFTEFARLLGSSTDTATIFESLFTAALSGSPDCAGMLAYNYLSGEPLTNLAEGRPMFLRTPESTLDLATFMRTQLFSSLATLRIGMDILTAEATVALDEMFAHGGLFKTPGVAQRLLAAAIDTPVTVADAAAEGGAWGIALLAAFAAQRTEQPLSTFLSETVFADLPGNTVQPDPTDVAGFNSFIRRYQEALPVQRAATRHA